jgi:ribosomal protein S30
MSSWADSIIYHAEAAWVAVCPVKSVADLAHVSQVDSGRVKKQTPWDKNPLKNNAPYEENVKFAHAFSSIPTVTPFLAALDSANNSNLRLNVSVSDVTTQGFKLTLSSWADTTVYHAEAGWVAHAACHNKPSQVQVGRVKKQTPWDKNPLKEKAPYEENVKFAHPFHCVPKVNVGVAAVDGAANANYRLNVTASDVTAHGFKLSMSSWADTTVYHAEASWVATA